MARRTTKRVPWQYSDRKQRLPHDWPIIRQRIIERDNGICQMPTADRSICAKPGRDVDHRQRGDDHSDENLWLLCRSCHLTKTNAEALAARV